MSSRGGRERSGSGVVRYAEFWGVVRAEYYVDSSSDFIPLDSEYREELDSAIYCAVNLFPCEWLLELEEITQVEVPLREFTAILEERGFKQRYELIAPEGVFATLVITYDRKPPHPARRATIVVYSNAVKSEQYARALALCLEQEISTTIDAYHDTTSDFVVELWIEKKPGELELVNRTQTISHSEKYLY